MPLGLGGAYNEGVANDTRARLGRFGGPGFDGGGLSLNEMAGGMDVNRVAISLQVTRHFHAAWAGSEDSSPRGGQRVWPGLSLPWTASTEPWPKVPPGRFAHL